MNPTLPIPSAPSESSAARAGAKESAPSAPAAKPDASGGEPPADSGTEFADALEVAIAGESANSADAVKADVALVEELHPDRQGIAADGNAVPVPVAPAVPALPVAAPLPVPADASSTPAADVGAVADAAAVAATAVDPRASSGRGSVPVAVDAGSTPAGDESGHDGDGPADPRLAKARTAGTAPVPGPHDPRATAEARAVEADPAVVARATAHAPGAHASAPDPAPGAAARADTGRAAPDFANVLASAPASAPQAPAHAPSADATVPRFDVPVPATDPGWADAVGDRVRWLVHERHGVAELQLNPPDLGRIEVRVTLTDGEARVMFTAHHPAGREHLQAALPHLRDYFEGSGIALADAGVHDGRTPFAGGGDGGGGQHSGGPAHEAVQEPASATLRARRGMVDDFA